MHTGPFVEVEPGFALADRPQACSLAAGTGSGCGSLRMTEQVAMAGRRS
jgi:hypothetical protein